MGFEVFEKPRGARSESNMGVRVSKDGTHLHLNGKAYDALGQAPRVLLLRDGSVFGFRAADLDEEKAFGSQRGTITCTAFIAAMGLQRGTKYPLRMEGGVLRSE